MVAKCGEVRIRHWAHERTLLCDPWLENETEWHRKWKEQFPRNWQEFVYRAENGEKHIADVRTDHEWVIEFQHSYINPEERRSRDTFYPKLVWVVNGTRRKRDREQFARAWNEGAPVGTNSHVRRLRSEECAMLKEWADSHVPIFFDFGGELLWWVCRHPAGPLVALFSRAVFIEMHRGGETQMASNFDEFVKELPRLVAKYESDFSSRRLTQASPHILRSQQYLARRNRLRKRL